MNKCLVIRGVVTEIYRDYVLVSIVLGTESRTEEGHPLPKIVQVRSDYHRVSVIDAGSKYSIAFSDEVTLPPRFVKKGDTLLLTRHCNNPQYAYGWCYEEEAAEAKLLELEKVVKPVGEFSTTVASGVVAAKTPVLVEKTVMPEVVAGKLIDGIVKVEEAFVGGNGKGGPKKRNGHGIAPVSKYRQRPSKMLPVVSARELATV